jgi:RNA polymerase sigma factor (sigma-70 family)
VSLTPVSPAMLTGWEGTVRRPSPSRRGEGASDAQLVAAAIDHQDWAWARLVERYTNLVYSITRSHRLRPADAAEVHQEVWVRLFEHLGRIRQPERVAGWIRAVAVNECLRTLEMHRRETLMGTDAVLDSPTDDDLDIVTLPEERRVALRRALANLPDRGRTLLETVLEDPGLSYEELAAKLDMPVGSIGPIRQRCLQRLRRMSELADLAA